VIQTRHESIAKVPDQKEPQPTASPPRTQVLHYLIRQFLGAFMVFSFEVLAIYLVVAALLHSDVVGIGYLILFAILVSQPRSALHRRWKVCKA
jgi:hypothetical protein